MYVYRTLPIYGDVCLCRHLLYCTFSVSLYCLSLGQPLLGGSSDLMLEKSYASYVASKWSSIPIQNFRGRILYSHWLTGRRRSCAVPVEVCRHGHFRRLRIVPYQSHEEASKIDLSPLVCLAYTFISWSFAIGHIRELPGEDLSLLRVSPGSTPSPAL